MKKMEEKSLREKGFIPVEEYVAKHIEECREEAALNAEKLGELLASIRAYEEASARFHQPDGDGYRIVLRCLQKYLDCKFIQKNRKFRFDVRESGISGDGESEYQYIARKKNAKQMIGTQADIYYLLFEAEQDSVAARRCKDYVHSGKLHLTAVLIHLIEQAVQFMDESEVKRMREYGRILRTVYMTAAHAEMESAELYGLLGYTKKQYYTLRNQAISVLSEYLFGYFAGEKGLADLYIKGSEIIIADMEHRDKK